MSYPFTITLSDPSNAAGTRRDALLADAKAALSDWLNYLYGYGGSLEVVVNVAPTTSGTIDSSTAQVPILSDAGVRATTSGADYEMLTGLDTNGRAPDIVINLDPSYLAQLWLDPNPVSPSAVPANLLDGTSAFRQAFGAQFGITTYRDHVSGQLPGTLETVWDALLDVKPDGSAFFVGQNAEAVYGGPVPVTVHDKYTGYYGLGTSTSQPAGLELMSGLPKATGKAYLVSKLDIAILRDIAAPVAQTSYTTPTTFAVGGEPSSLALADFNRDGQLDLVGTTNTATAGATSTPVFLALGHGDGTFAAAQTITTGINTTSAVVADVNADSRVDLLFINSQAGSVSLLLGNGDGTFAPKREVATANPHPVSVLAADLNGDGKHDLVVTSGRATIYEADPTTVSVMLGKGDGTFGQPQDVATGIAPSRAIATDLNGDGKLDLVTASYSYDKLSVLIGRGDGTFAPKVDLAVDRGPTAVIAADLNGDGKVDLVSTSAYNLTVSVLLGNGDGTFGARKDIHSTTGFFGGALAAADVTEDGKLDLVATNVNAYAPGSVSVLAGNGDGTFAAEQVFTTGTRSSSLAVSDLDGDEQPDIVVGNGSAASILLNTSTGPLFGPQLDATVGRVIHPLSPHDLGGDGKADIVFRNGSGLALLAQLSGGHQTAASAYLDVQLGADWAIASTTEDFNGDGKSDVLFRYKPSGATLVAFQNGSHQAEAATYADVQLGNDYSVRTADFDADGKADLLYRNIQSGAVIISVLEAGHQTKASAYAGVQLGTEYNVAGLGDFDGDGKADILYRKVSSGSTLIAFQDGAAQARPSAYTDVQLGNDWSIAGVADFTGDGKADILFRNLASGSTIVSVLDGGHQPIPSAYTDVQLGNAFEIAQVSDFDGDGKADILWRDASSGSTFIAFMNGARQAAPSAYTDVQLDHSWLIV